ncbi:hypothetical protein [Alloactinosynnema sp. L-07]|nr:hypothetical protein [Alloactinosynnema sp. L-07]
MNIIVAAIATTTGRGHVTPRCLRLNLGLGICAHLGQDR